VETQTSQALTATTRDGARVALARAFEEAAVMPGTLLPHEVIADLTATAARIVAEVTADDRADFVAEPSEPWAYIVEHSIDATVVGLLTGRRLLPREQLGDLGLGLFLQDIGMLALPESVVQKPGEPAADERALIMQHPLLGLEFLRDDAIAPAARSIVRSHHERWNGTGYPSGLVGDEIPLFARIAAVADVFDAATSERYHAPALSHEEGVEVVRAGAGSSFDPVVVEAFLAAVAP